MEMEDTVNEQVTDYLEVDWLQVQKAFLLSTKALLLSFSNKTTIHGKHFQ